MYTAVKMPIIDPNCLENLSEDEKIIEDQFPEGRNQIIGPMGPTGTNSGYSIGKANGIKKNSKQFSSSGFNMLLFVDNATLLGDYGRGYLIF